VRRRRRWLHYDARRALGRGLLVVVVAAGLLLLLVFALG
jgi:hypothetical protein